jgi:Uma2 family endonuclease
MTLVTANEYLATANDRPEHTELIEGEVVLNSPLYRHQAIITFLVTELTIWCRNGDASGGTGRGIASIEVDHKLDDRNVYAPDVWWVSEGHRPARGARTFVGPPDLAVEVRSESTWRYDVGTKAKIYERSGLQELWLVDTAADSVLVFRRSSPDALEFDVSLELSVTDLLTSPLLPEFAVSVASLFDR